MKLEIKKMNLFEAGKDYHLVHCISSDIALGAGIAVDFEKKYGLKNYLLTLDYQDRKHPQSILYKGVFNLITKEKYWNKPTYQSLEKCLEILKKQCKLADVKKLAMPKIGCGLDRLQWGKVREMINKIFEDTDIEILVCYI